MGRLGRLGVKIRVVSEYGNGAASVRSRVSEWIARIGVSAECLDYLGEPNIPASMVIRRPVGLVRAELALRRAGSQPADVVLLHRNASPFSRGHLEERVLASGDRSVVDFDDSVQWDWRAGFAGLIRRPSSFLRAVRAADVVIAGNDFLANWAAEWCNQILIIPTCVEPADYEAKTDFSLVGPPRIGWIGSPSTERYLRLIEGPLLELHRRTGAELIVISTGHQSLGALDQMLRRIQWSTHTQSQLASLMDVAVMPLDDSIWSRGKCGYKLLQYAAAAVPGIASPSGVNDEICDGFGYERPRSPDDWLSSLLGAVSCSPEARRQVGRGARKAVERYSYSAWLPRWTEAVFGDTLASDVRKSDQPGAAVEVAPTQLGEI